MANPLSLDEAEQALFVPAFGARLSTVLAVVAGRSSRVAVVACAHQAFRLDIDHLEAELAALPECCPLASHWISIWPAVLAPRLLPPSLAGGAQRLLEAASPDACGCAPMLRLETRSEGVTRLATARYVHEDGCPEFGVSIWPPFDAAA